MADSQNAPNMPRFQQGAARSLSEEEIIPKNKTKQDKGRHQNSLGLFPVDL